MNNNSNYKTYLLRQLGLKESQLPPSAVNEDDDVPFMDDADKLANAAMGGPISPTAIPTPVIGMAVRGSSTGGFPSGCDQTGIMPNTPTGRLGGYEPIPTDTRLNSKIVDATPQNCDINSGNPIDLHPQPIPQEPHPHQVQQNNGQAPQNLTGASTDSDSTLKLKPDMPMDVDVDVHGGNEKPQDEKDDQKEETKDLNNMDGEESMEDEDNAKAGGLSEGKHKKGCKCGFCMNTHRFGKKDKEDKKDKKDDKDDGHHVFPKKDDDEDNEKKVDETFKRHTMLMKEYLGIKEAKCKCGNPDCKCGPDCKCCGGVNECATCGCGQKEEEGKDHVGASKPFVTHWKMDKEKAGMVKVDENSALSKKLASIPTNKLQALQESIKSKTVSKVTTSDKVISEAITKTLKMRSVNEAFMRHKKLMTEAVNRD